MADISENTLMKIEQGQTRNPGVLTVSTVCRALNITVDELLRSPEAAKLQEATMTHGIVSAGYQGRTIESFVEALQEAGVSTVADVRLNAISRKSGFSKTRLREALTSAGIDYVHLRSLGNAKENRKPFWDGRLDEGRRNYRNTLETAEAKGALRQLGALANKQVVALLCFEGDIQSCHRKVIIDEVTGAQQVPVIELPA